MLASKTRLFESWLYLACALRISKFSYPSSVSRRYRIRFCIVRGDISRMLASGDAVFEQGTKSPGGG